MSESKKELLQVVSTAISNSSVNTCQEDDKFGSVCLAIDILRALDDSGYLVIKGQVIDLAVNFSREHEHE